MTMASQNAQVAAVQEMAIANASEVHQSAMQLVSTFIAAEKCMLQREAAWTVASIESNAREAIAQQQGLSADQLQNLHGRFRQ